MHFAPLVVGGGTPLPSTPPASPQKKPSAATLAAKTTLAGKATLAAQATLAEKVDAAGGVGAVERRWIAPTRSDSYYTLVILVTTKHLCSKFWVIPVTVKHFCGKFCRASDSQEFVW